MFIALLSAVLRLKKKDEAHEALRQLTTENQAKVAALTTQIEELQTQVLEHQARLDDISEPKGSGSEPERNRSRSPRREG